MPTLSYRQPGLTLGVGSAATAEQIRDLQRDLRRLGYLRRGIDGVFGPVTEHAVRALRYDLLHNNGESRGSDGPAPVRVTDYNRGRVATVSAKVDSALVACISDMLDDPRFPKLPASPDPSAQNWVALSRIRSLPPTRVPIPFLLAVLKQQSGLAHFRVPSGADADSFILLDMRCSDLAPHVVLARYYGLGYFPLFHHPPRWEEVGEIMLDPVANVQHALQQLLEGLERCVTGPDARAFDRLAERGDGALILCKYPVGDPRHMRDCRNCAASVERREIRAGLPLHPGSQQLWQPSPRYTSAAYREVPAREQLGCDWPYAARQHGGDGVDSYHFQVRVLQYLAGIPSAPASAP